MDRWRLTSSVGLLLGEKVGAMEGAKEGEYVVGSFDGAKLGEYVVGSLEGAKEGE